MFDSTLRVMRTWAIKRHLLRLSGGWMGAGHVPELCSAVLNPTFGLMHVGGPSVLTHHGNNLSAADPRGKDLRAAKAVVACMFSQRFLRAWRNLFVPVPRSKVYRWSIDGSISCTDQLL